MNGLAYTGWDSNAVFEICHTMRPADALEVFATMPANDPDQVFACWALQKDQMPLVEVVWRKAHELNAVVPVFEDHPLAICTITLLSPGVAAGNMIATPDMTPREFVAWARRLRDRVPAICRANGIHRLQCSCRADHAEAQRFLKWCGWTYEGPEAALGRSGEDYQRWAALGRDFAGADAPLFRHEEAA